MRPNFIIIAGEKVFTTRTPDGVFEFLEQIIGPAAAIEASSWCELACIGEEYETDDVFITFYE